MRLDGSLELFLRLLHTISGSLNGSLQAWKRSLVRRLQLRYLVGEVTVVSALVSTIAFDYDVDDTATMLLEMEGGAHAVVSSHWSTLIPDRQESSVLAIYGTGGTILSTPLQDKFSRGSLKLMTGTQQTEYHFEESTHVQMLEAFAASIERDEPVPITGQDGVAVSKVIAAAYQSAREGRAVLI